MNVYIKHHPDGAGKWIYTGYARAWESLRHNVILYTSLSQIDKKAGPYYVMAIDGDITSDQDLENIKGAKKAFVYTQPNTFPDPWGRHPNFQCHCPDRMISKLNDIENVKLWCFGRNLKYHTKWKDVQYVPLAFDNVSYSIFPSPEEYQYDVCYIGGLADNGFNEKAGIMKKHIAALQKAGLKLGVSIQGGISHEQENHTLAASKIALNMHDAYQQALGLDTNERTFKSLGVNGLLLSDDVLEVNKLFGDRVFIYTSPEDLVDQAQYVIRHLPEYEQVRIENRARILQFHTYMNRIQELLR